MAAYFASEALVEMSEYVAPLSSHAIAFDRVSGLSNLLIPLVVDFTQKLDQLSFSGKGIHTPSCQPAWQGTEERP